MTRLQATRGSVWLLPIVGCVAIGALDDGARAADCGPATNSCIARSCCTCPDNYCPKPQPCVPCAPIGRCDDYCPKPVPCTAPLRYCGPNDYCAKPCCLYLPPCWPGWYQCGAPVSTPASR